MEQPVKNKFIHTLATFIVDKRDLFFLLYVLAIAFSFVSSGWVTVNSDITSYLDDSTETRQGLVIMEEEFYTYATAQVMVSNVTYEQADALAGQLSAIDGISSVSFDSSAEHYKNASALFDVTFAGQEEDDISQEAMTALRQTLADYDVSISSDVGNALTDTLAQEMSMVLVIVAVVIVAVLLFTSKTYGEVPVLILTFGAAVLLNKGTNYWFQEISFVSNSVTVVLQLALSIDYAIILCHRFSEEREHLAAREACIQALEAAIPEISSSCLTTISGLAALVFMQFHLGADLSLVLIKSIFFSLLSVFTLMPGLLMLFSPLMDRTRHKNLVPHIRWWGKATVKLRYVVPPLFVVLLAAAFVFSSRCPYVYGYSTLSTLRQNDSQIAEKKIQETFGSSNDMALVVPAGNYEAEAELLDKIALYDCVEYDLGLANIQVTDDYRLTDKLTPRQFGELAGLDIAEARLLYAGYLIHDENYGQLVQSLDSCAVPLIDMFLYAYDRVQEGYVTLDRDKMAKLTDYYDQIQDGKKQLQGENYSRLVISTSLPVEGDETQAFLQTLHTLAERYYDEPVYLVGSSTSCRDLSDSFATDNLLITVLTILFVLIILLFTFQSAGLPVLLILVIEGSIWINFSFPYLTGKNMFFLGYLIVSSIQMGANIDYAIVISSRYMELKKDLPYKEAMVQTLDLAFPTVLTSGLIMSAAGTVISFLTSENTIYCIGQGVGRGTLISMLLVLGVLPEILLLGDTIIEKTSFSVKLPERSRSLSGKMYVNGHVRGRIDGVVDAHVRGVVIGDIDAILAAGNVEKISEDRPTLPGQEEKGQEADSKEVTDHEA
jgi:predicted RND superfamily exporter protein